MQPVPTGPADEARCRFLPADAACPMHTAEGWREVSGLALVRESNHRIKNNLQLVASMLSMQARSASEPRIAAQLIDAGRRVTAVAHLHERLQVDDGIAVAVAPLLKEVCADIVYSSGCDKRGVSIELMASPLKLPAERALALALILNELATNSLKHAYERCPGRICVTLEQSPVRRLSVADYGLGSAIASGDGFGFTLVKQLARRLDGAFSFETHETGALATLRF